MKRRGRLRRNQVAFIFKLKDFGLWGGKDFIENRSDNVQSQETLISETAEERTERGTGCGMVECHFPGTIKIPKRKGKNKKSSVLGC